MDFLVPIFQRWKPKPREVTRPPLGHMAGQRQNRDLNLGLSPESLWIFSWQACFTGSCSSLLTTGDRLVLSHSKNDIRERPARPQGRDRIRSQGWSTAERCTTGP